MRRSRKPLTVGNLMIAVVACAISIKVGLIYSRSPKYWEEARLYARTAQYSRHLAKLFEEGEIQIPRRSMKAAVKPGVSEAEGPDLAELDRKQEAERQRKFAEYADRMNAKYRRAAFLPWAPGAPALSSP